RSRSAFKLIELDEKHHLLSRGMTVVDLGCAPGGWCQVAAERVGPSGRVIGLDVLEMDPLTGVEFLRGDFTEDEPLAALEASLGGR
ncbi:23S rRNA methyltransferase, partial [Staphylococcus warneri]